MIKNSSAISTLALSLLILAPACGDSGGDDPDTGVVADTGIHPDANVPPPDAGRPDLGTPDLGTPDLGTPDTGIDGGTPDVGYDGGPEDAGPPPPTDVRVYGTVYKLGAYLLGNNELNANTNVTALGTFPLQSALSDGTGAYQVQLPANGYAFMWLSKAGYNPTYQKVSTTTVDLNQNLYSVENAWVNAIAAAHNVTLANHACNDAALGTCQYGIVVGRLYDDGAAGAVRPAGGVPRYKDVGQTIPAWSVKDNAGADWYFRGPYFLNYDGTPDAAAVASIQYNDNGNYRGGLYVMFVDVPIAGPEAIDVTVSVEYPNNAETRYFGPHTVKTFRNFGVTWYHLYQNANPPPPVVGDVDFDTQVYPLFLPVAQGGFGCIGCHTNQGGAIPAGGMNLYGGADIAYASLNPANYPQRVNLTTPADSYVLTKPLYEAEGPQNHPIYAFANTQDPGYQLIYTWIQEGAVRNFVPPPVSFYDDIRPLLYRPAGQGGVGCYACHVNGVDANTAPGGAYYGGDGNALHAVLTAQTPTDNGATGEAYRVNLQYPERSLLLTNPTEGVEPHPIKPFLNNADARYQLLYRWIAEGALNDTP